MQCVQRSAREYHLHDLAKNCIFVKHGEDSFFQIVLQNCIALLFEKKGKNLGYGNNGYILPIFMSLYVCACLHFACKSVALCKEEVPKPKVTNLIFPYLNAQVVVPLKVKKGGDQKLIFDTPTNFATLNSRVREGGG